MKKFVAATSVIVVLALVGFGVWYLMNSLTTYSGTTESITIGYSPFESVALLCIAEDQHFFSRNGLNVTSLKYDTGVGALDGMINGEADIAVGTNEFPLVGRAFQKERISTIGCIAKSEFIWVNAVANGDIDAVATAQPYANSAKDRLGANAVVWSAQSSQPLYTQVISTNDWIAKNPELIRRFLKSLAEAEKYVNTHPAQANAIVQKRLNPDSVNIIR